ncbi:hypothetical protein ACR2XK_26220, partial [Klebsiella pneumoniae]
MDNLIDKNMNQVKESLGNANSSDVLPLPYKDIAKKFEEVKEKGESIIIEEGGFPYTDSTVMYIEHVTDRWAGGYSLIRHEGEEVKVPKTIHFSDIYVKDKSHKVRI